MGGTCRMHKGVMRKICPFA